MSSSFIHYFFEWFLGGSLCSNCFMFGCGLTSGLPATFKRPLMSQETTEGSSVVLHCELDKPAPSVEWRRGSELLTNGDKYQMRKKDLQVEMKIVDLELDDSGEYTCVCGDQRTTAEIHVNGESDREV